MDELLKKTGTAQNTQTSTTGGNSAQITSMYDAQKAGNEARLKAAYEQNRSDLEASRAKISPLYQTQANDLAVQYERNRRNANEQAAANGLNTGARSQMALAQNSAWQREHGALRGQEAEAVTEADRNIVNLTNQYNSNVAANNADIEAKKTAALIDENNRQETLALNREKLDRDKAQLLASYGDFSGYAALYGDEIANNMLNLWTAQNPDLAYNTGKINAERYKAITGEYPIGYTPAGGSGGGGYQGMTTSDYGYDNAKGLTSSQIKQLQAGLGVSVDGVWGPETEAAYNAADGGSSKVPQYTAPSILEIFNQQMKR